MNNEACICFTFIASHAFDSYAFVAHAFASHAFASHAFASHAAYFLSNGVLGSALSIGVKFLISKNVLFPVLGCMLCSGESGTDITDHDELLPKEATADLTRDFLLDEDIMVVEDCAVDADLARGLDDLLKATWGRNIF